MKKLLIIDTFNFLHRAYHAIPKNFSDSEGNPTNAIYGVTSMLVSTFEQLRPDYAICAVESKEPLLRSTEFEAYKAQRKPMGEDLVVQIPKVFEIIDAFGIHTIQAGGYEADDVIATLVAKYLHHALEILILSNDRDLWQIVSPKVSIMLPVKEGNIEFIGPDQVLARMGFSPKLIADFKALKGDPSDNIAGVSGIGEKTAKELIIQYGDLDSIYKAVESHPQTFSPAVLKRLVDGKESAYKCKNLVLLVSDLDFAVDLDDCVYTEFNRGRVKEVLFKYNFKSIIKRLGFENPKPLKHEINEDQLGLF